MDMKMTEYESEEDVYDATEQKQGMIKLSPIITTNRNDYDRIIKLKDLFTENKFDILQIQFKNPNDKFIFPMNNLSICQNGGLGIGLFPNNYDLTKNYQLFKNDKINCYTSPDILEINVDLSSFYDDPTPYDFKNDPRMSSKYVAGYLWNEIIRYNH